MKSKLPSLNGLRAISVIIIVIHHFFIQTPALRKLNENEQLRPFIHFIQDGHLAVSIFFIISGFLITSLLMKEEKQTETISLKKFYLRRTLRIFPAYYFLLLCYFGLHSLGFIHISGDSWLTALTYTKDFNYHQADWFTWHAWTLSIEEQFYLCWPFIFLLGNVPRKIFAFAVVLIVPIIRLYTYYNPVSWITEYTIFLRIDTIGLGCLAAIYKDQILAFINAKYWKTIFWISIAIILLIPFAYVLTDPFGLSTIWIVIGTAHGTIANICVTLIMLYSIYFSKGLWFKFLNTKAMDFIGVLSYSIYLWQQLFTFKSHSFISIFPINLLLIIAAALFSYYVIEKPFLKLKSKFETAKITG